MRRLKKKLKVVTDLKVLFVTFWLVSPLPHTHITTIIIYCTNCCNVRLNKRNMWVSEWMVYQVQMETALLQNATG